MTPAIIPSVGGAAIRALHSLTRRDADAVRATVRAAARGHTVQEHDDYDGYLSLLVSAEDDGGPAFLVAGRSGAVDLAEVQGDDMVALGTFPSMGAAMAVLRPALERSADTQGRGTDGSSTSADAAALIARHGTEAAVHAALLADARPDARRWAEVLRVIDTSDGTA